MYLKILFKSKALLIIFCSIILLRQQIQSQNFKAIHSTEGIEISENGKKILFYQKAPKSLNGKFERAGYVHPLYSLHEKALTEDFPEDHPYHRGIFWAWHQIILNNKMIADGWTCENISWNLLKVDIIRGEKSLGLQAELIWKVGLNGKSTNILKENTIITVHHSTGDRRAIDFDIQLSSIVSGLKIGGSDDVKGYGGFCLRLDLPENISFYSGDKEVIPQDTAVEAGPWMQFRGSFDKEASGETCIAVFCHPSNPGPQHKWILRKESSMQNIPYPGRKPIPLTKRGLRLRYRIIIHDASLKKDDIEKLYLQYIHS